MDKKTENKWTIVGNYSSKEEILNKKTENENKWTIVGNYSSYDLNYSRTVSLLRKFR